jgi:Holliday junction resolvase RusA-like endonuclease
MTFAGDPMGLSKPLEIIIPIRPKGFMRAGAQITNSEGKTFRVNPKEYKEYQTKLGWLVKPFKPQAQIEGAVEVSILCVFKMPPNWTPEKKFEKAYQVKSVPIDGDNLIKAVMDSLEKAGWYKNDGQVGMGGWVSVWGHTDILKITITPRQGYSYPGIAELEAHFME